MKRAVNAQCIEGAVGETAVNCGLTLGMVVCYISRKQAHLSYLSLLALFRTCGNPTWPDNGEIDIIEYVNTDSVDATTLHTNGGCDQAGVDPNSFTGLSIIKVHPTGSISQSSY